jgi:hypothetical protein
VAASAARGKVTRKITRADKNNGQLFADADEGDAEVLIVADMVFLLFVAVNNASIYKQASYHATFRQPGCLRETL